MLYFAMNIVMTMCIWLTFCVVHPYYCYHLQMVVGLIGVLSMLQKCRFNPWYCQYAVSLSKALFQLIQLKMSTISEHNSEGYLFRVICSLEKIPLQNKHFLLLLLLLLLILYTNYFTGAVCKNARNQRGWTALMFASRMGQLHVLETLVDLGYVTLIHMYVLQVFN